MNVAQKLVECLAAEGVEYIFGVPGEENLEVIEAIAESPIRFITTRHEQGAAFMADVYGRLTGKAGVCLATLGPGATNLITGVADANSDGAPLVAITGQVSSERMHITGHQYLDLNFAIILRTLMPSFMVLSLEILLHTTCIVRLMSPRSIGA